MSRLSMSRVFLVFLGAVALLSCESPFGAGVPEGVPEEVREFVIEMNEHRASLELEVLEWDASLAGVAQAHSQDMHDRAFFDHVNPDGDGPADRIVAAGITASYVGENIAAGYSTGEAVFDAWINSSGHRSNIENSSYTHHGVGYVADGHYWTHVFAKNPSK